MESKKEVGQNTIILVSVIFVLLSFILIQPTSPTGLISLPLIGETEDLSDPTLIGAIVLLVVVWVTVFVLFKKLKKKRNPNHNLPEVPGPVNTIEPNQLKDIQKKEGLTEDELKQLFREIMPKIETQVLDQKKEVKLSEKLVEQKAQEVKTIEPKPELKLPPPKEVKKAEPQLAKKPSDINELNKIMLSLIKKSYTMSSIIKYLQKKGWELKQIAQAVHNINNNNLKEYIRTAVSLGYDKKAIVNNLLPKGWTLNEINQAMMQ